MGDKGFQNDISVRSLSETCFCYISDTWYRYRDFLHVAQCKLRPYAQPRNGCRIPYVSVRCLAGSIA